jgi:chromosome segregation ATPase
MDRTMQAIQLAISGMAEEIRFTGDALDRAKVEVQQLTEKIEELREEHRKAEETLAKLGE